MIVSFIQLLILWFVHVDRRAVARLCSKKFKYRANPDFRLFQGESMTKRRIVKKSLTE